MLQSGLNNIEELKVETCDFEYHKVTEAESWRINFLKELVETKHGDLEVVGMEPKELEQILEYICTS